MANADLMAALAAEIEKNAATIRAAEIAVAEQKRKRRQEGEAFLSALFAGPPDLLPAADAEGAQSGTEDPDPSTPADLSNTWWPEKDTDNTKETP